MDSHLVSQAPPVVRATRSARYRAVRSLGPLTAVGGVVWALVQPWRLTFLDPVGLGFWELLVEPPLLVIAAGVLFHLLVARGVLEDLEELERS
jgi:hypothetical protein